MWRFNLGLFDSVTVVHGGHLALDLWCALLIFVVSLLSFYGLRKDVVQFAKEGYRGIFDVARGVSIDFEEFDIFSRTKVNQLYAFIGSICPSNHPLFFECLCSVSSVDSNYFSDHRGELGRDI